MEEPEVMGGDSLKDPQLYCTIQMHVPVYDNSTEVRNSPSPCDIVLCVVCGENRVCRPFNEIPLSEVVHYESLIHVSSLPRFVETYLDEDEVSDGNTFSFNVSEPLYCFQDVLSLGCQSFRLVCNPYSFVYRRMVALVAVEERLDFRT